MEGLQNGLMHGHVTRRLASQQLHHHAVGVLEAFHIFTFALRHVPILIQVKAHLAPAEVIHKVHLQAQLHFQNCAI